MAPLNPAARLPAYLLQAQDHILQQLQALRFEHARHTADMQAKLAWYAENQELLKGSEELVRQQASTIIQLEQQLLSPARQCSREQGRLAELQRENESLKVVRRSWLLLPSCRQLDGMKGPHSSCFSNDMPGSDNTVAAPFSFPAGLPTLVTRML